MPTWLIEHPFAGRARLLLWPGGIALGLAAEWAAFGLDDPRRAIPDLATGWTLLACGLVAQQRRPDSRVGMLLAATGATWFAGNFADAALYVHRGPLVNALLTYPGGRVQTRTEGVAVAVGYAAALIAPVGDAEWATLAFAAVLVLVAWQGRVTSLGWERRARAASLAATIAFALVLAAGAIARLEFPAGDADAPALLAYELVLCGIGVGLAGGLIARGWERTPLTDLVVELSETRSGTLRDALAHALGDPTLEVGYRMPGATGYVDAAGQPLKLPEPGSPRALTVVQRDGRAIAALVHDPSVLDEPLLVEAVAEAARLAASNARLQGAVRAQIAELEASRRRLVVAGDDGRRRLEQRLRDGAGRRLASLAETLAQARARRGSPARIEVAEAVLARTQVDLRELAHGLHPSSLRETGLVGALDALIRDTMIPVELLVTEERLEGELGRVAYFVCAEALANVTKHAAADRAAIAIRHRDDCITVEIQDDGAGGADFNRGTGLRGLADRVEARGGRLRVDSPPGGGTRVVAEIPLHNDAR